MFVSNVCFPLQDAYAEILAPKVVLGDGVFQGYQVMRVEPPETGLVL